MQTPPNAAITGFELASIMRMTVWSVGSAVARGVSNSRMSAPPEKSSALPMITIAWTSGSACARSMSTTIPVRTSPRRALDIACSWSSFETLCYTSSHSRRTEGLACRDCGVPSNTMRPWPMT